ncbi:uncharacterized protein LOC143470945 [Clavelina lepadiformis]|uniref:uncharacterized protein LOC143470945 n=1 Tax=Clavelina lepadiformis TaxID=159417 RepID=UPI0040423A1A
MSVTGSTLSRKMYGLRGDIEDTLEDLEESHHYLRQDTRQVRRLYRRLNLVAPADYWQAELPIYDEDFYDLIPVKGQTRTHEIEIKTLPDFKQKRTKTSMKFKETEVSVSSPPALGRFNSDILINASQVKVGLKLENFKSKPTPPADSSPLSLCGIRLLSTD